MKLKLIYLKPTNTQNLSGKLLLADTSFLIKAAKTGTTQNTIKQNLFKNGCALAYNVTILAETIHLTRFEMVEHHIRSNGRGVTTGVTNKWNSIRSRNEKMKEMVKSHNSLITSIMGKSGAKIRKQVDYVLDGCTYRGSSSSITASWDDVYRIVGDVGLDSSDSMILNLALSNTVFDGIISSDHDYAKATSLTTNRSFGIYLAM